MSIKKSDMKLGFGDLSVQRILVKLDEHELIQIRREFSFECFRDKLESLYSHTGRPAYDPVKMMRLLVLGKIENISDNKLAFHVLTNVLYREFCGFGIDEDTPDNCTIGEFRVRIMPLWDELFAQFNKWLSDKNYVGDSLAIIDSTALAARGKFRKDDAKKDDSGKTDYSAQSDPDARHSKMSANKLFYGYKGHIMTDADSDFIVGVDFSRGSLWDGAILQPLVLSLPFLPKQITGDKAYWSYSNVDFLRSMGIGDKIIPQKFPKSNLSSSHKKRRLIERVFAVIKGKIGLCRTRFFGLAKCGIDFKLAALAYNLINIITFNNRSKMEEMLA
jgi:transposase, IS5 family